MTGYRGRFAPTPSGPLHLGSLLAAVASYLQARHHRGEWQIRIDDLDRARCPEGADLRILQQLRSHGLAWDGEPYYQTAHAGDYHTALATLQSAGHLYPCGCSRARLKQIGLPGPDEPVYPGHCRDHSPAAGRPHSLRMRVPPGPLCVDDGLAGRTCRDLEREVGDFVVCRTDGLPAYQLACAVDEAAMRITEVVRGRDLLGSTFRQRCLMQALGLRPPAYLHHPVLLGRDRAKLSKQNHAAALEDAAAPDNLRRCLGWLGQEAPPAEQRHPGEILSWAVPRWRLGAIPAVASIPLA